MCGEGLPEPLPLHPPPCTLTVSSVSAEPVTPGAGCLQGTHFQCKCPPATAVGDLGLGWISPGRGWAGGRWAELGGDAPLRQRGGGFPRRAPGRQRSQLCSSERFCFVTPAETQEHGEDPRPQPQDEANDAVQVGECMAAALFSGDTQHLLLGDSVPGLAQTPRSDIPGDFCCLPFP